MVAHGQQQQGSCSSGGRRKEDDGAKIRVEFAVNINDQKDLEKIDEALKRKGVSLVSSDLEGKIIKLDLPRDHNNKNAGQSMENALSLQRFIEEQTGFLTVVKGLGELRSAVAELRPPSGTDENRSRIMGVVRMTQLEDSHCYVDGSIEGLSKLLSSGNRYSLAIHEYGDLGGDKYEHIGNSMIQIDESNSGLDDANFRVINKNLPNCDVASMIGKSVALTELQASKKPDCVSDIKQVLSAGVIARASTIGANKKQICSCSGKTLWEERLDQKQTTTNQKSSKLSA